MQTEDPDRPSRIDGIDFNDEVVIVTGGAQGIGEQICRTFAGLDADIAIADVAIDDAGALSEELADATTDTLAVETDVSSYEDATAMAETVLDAFGRLDVLVNNAGVGDVKPFLETEPEEWDTWVGVSYFGTMNCTHAVLPTMVEQESGAIVNFASDSYKGNDIGVSVYGGAKAANVSFTKTIAKEVGEHDIRMNCVSPATTETPSTADWIDEYGDQLVEGYALNRLGRPADHADAVAFLASDAADWITGQTLSVNGGYHKG
jgi:NAD(P)-dependent dehydrogenase (short-subunit alcohol dehydrogenase family)